jgi:hypothetical protein
MHNNNPFMADTKKSVSELTAKYPAIHNKEKMIREKYL